MFVMLRFENGEEMPFVVDTGASWTVFDKSMAPKLGKRLDTISLGSWSGTHRASVYAAPKLYLGSTLLVISNVITCDFNKLGYPGGIGGILGMDCLKHYRIQLDFDARLIRFLNGDGVDPAELGEAFPLTISWNLPFISDLTLAGTNKGSILIDTGYDIDGQVEKRNDTADNFQSMHLPERVWHGATYTNVIVRQHHNKNVLGLRFLARHLVTFDFPQKTMYLKQVSVGPRDDENIEDAVEFLKGLKDTGQLPGARKGEKGWIYPDPHSSSRILSARKKRDPFIYHYRISRASNDSSWTLEQAWRTDQNDRILEEYVISSSAK